VKRRRQRHRRHRLAATEQRHERLDGPRVGERGCERGSLGEVSEGRAALRGQLWDTQHAHGSVSSPEGEHAIEWRRRRTSGSRRAHQARSERLCDKLQSGRVGGERVARRRRARQQGGGATRGLVV